VLFREAGEATGRAASASVAARIGRATPSGMAAASFVGRRQQLHGPPPGDRLHPDVSERPAPAGRARFPSTGQASL